MTRGRRAIIAEDEGRLVAKHQDVVVEEEKEEEKEEEDDQLMKGPIIVEKTEINKEKQKQKKWKKWKNEKEKESEREEEKKSKSERAREKKNEASLVEGREMPYPLVPSMKDKERHLARFLDIFKKLEITMPFGEALQQMLLYSKFLKKKQYSNLPPPQ